jgi:hypothetical protein
MRTILVIAVSIAIPMAVWGGVTLGARAACTLGVAAFAITLGLAFLLQTAWRDLLGTGPANAEERPWPDEVVRERERLRSPGAPRFVLLAEARYWPTSLRQEWRVAIWDQPAERGERGTIQSHLTGDADRYPGLAKAFVDRELTAGEVESFRAWLAAPGPVALGPVKGLLVRDGTPAAVYCLEQGMDQVFVGSMHFPIEPEPLPTPPTVRLFEMISKAAGLSPTDVFAQPQ